MTVACFAKADDDVKIRLDRSLGENDRWDASVNTKKKKSKDHGVWDPLKPGTLEGSGENGCTNPGNKCSFSNKICDNIFDNQGTRGPNCDLPIQQVVSYCERGSLTPEQGFEALNIIDDKYSQVT